VISKRDAIGATGSSGNTAVGIPDDMVCLLEQAGKKSVA